MNSNKDMYTLHSSIMVRITGHSLASRIRHSLVMGLSRTDVFVWTFTEWTRPFPSGLASSTLRNSQDPQGAVGSTTRTMSPTFRFFFTDVHFCLSCCKRRFLGPSAPEEVSQVLDLFPSASGVEIRPQEGSRGQSGHRSEQEDTIRG